MGILANLVVKQERNQHYLHYDEFQKKKTSDRILPPNNPIVS